MAIEISELNVLVLIFIQRIVDLCNFIFLMKACHYLKIMDLTGSGWLVFSGDQNRTSLDYTK